MVSSTKKLNVEMKKDSNGNEKIKIKYSAKTSKPKTLLQFVTSLLSMKTDLKKISPDIDDHMDKNLPCFVIMGGQSTAKSATASRILGCVQTEISNERCTKVFYEYTMIAGSNDDNSLKDYKVKINHAGEDFYNGVLNLDNQKDKLVLLKQLADVQKMIGQKPENEGKEFYNTTVGVEILSPKLSNSYVLIDTPGLIQMNKGQVNSKVVEELNSALRDITSKKKNVKWCITHDAQQQLDNCDGLAFLRRQNVNKKDIMLLMTKCDRVMKDDRPVFIKNCLQNKLELLPDNIFCVSNRSEANSHPLSDEAEKQWFADNLPEMKKNIGVSEFRNTISKNSALAIVDYFKSIEEELIKPAARKNREKQNSLNKEIKANNMGGHQIIERVKKRLVFMREAKISADVENQALIDCKRELKEIYTTKLTDQYENLFKRLYEDWDEEQVENKWGDEFGDATVSKNKANVLEHIYQTIGPDADITVVKPIFNVFCQKRITATMEDPERRELIDECLNVWRKSLEVICEGNTQNMPKMEEFLTHYFFEHEEHGWTEMKKKFEDYVNFVQFKLYTLCTPFDKMVGENLDLHSIEDCGKIKTITSLDPMADVMVIKLGDYFKNALTMFEMNTNAAMRMICIVEHANNLYDNLSEEYAKFKENHNPVLTDADMTRNEANLDILDEIKELKQNQAFLDDFTNLIQQADLFCKSSK